MSFIYSLPTGGLVRIYPGLSMGWGSTHAGAGFCMRRMRPSGELYSDGLNTNRGIMPWLDGNPVTSIPMGKGAPCIWGPLGPELMGFEGVGAMMRPGSRSMGMGFFGGYPMAAASAPYV